MDTAVSLARLKERVAEVENSRRRLIEICGKDAGLSMEQEIMALSGTSLEQKLSALPEQVRSVLRSVAMLASRVEVHKWVLVNKLARDGLPVSDIANAMSSEVEDVERFLRVDNPH